MKKITFFVFIFLISLEFYSQTITPAFSREYGSGWRISAADDGNRDPALFKLEGGSVRLSSSSADHGMSARLYMDYRGFVSLSSGFDDNFNPGNLELYTNGDFSLSSNNFGISSSDGEADFYANKLTLSSLNIMSFKSTRGGKFAFEAGTRSSVKLGIGTSDPKETLHVNGAIRGHIANGALRVKSDDGYLDLGARNSSYAHIYTDRPKVIFNKDVYTTSNAFSSYNNDLILKTEGNERLRINDDTGNVGIGTTVPEAKLHVKDDMIVENGAGGKFKISSHSGVDGSLVEEFIDLELRTSFNKNSGFKFYSNSDADSTFSLNVGSNVLMNSYFSGRSGFINIGEGSNIDVTVSGKTESKIIKATEKIHIGSNTAAFNAASAYSLSIEGKAIAEEIKVQKKEDWSDFVFYDDYKLPTLKEVERHISEKGHLKDIPSAAEVAENGFFLGEMDAKLLQKIEELTLYTLQQEKKIEALEKKDTENTKIISQLSNLLQRVEQLESK